MELSENPYNVDYNNEQYKLGLADGYNKAKDEYYEKMKSVEMQIEFRKQNSINESYNKGFYDGDNYGMSHSHPDLRPENREHKMGM